MEDFNPKAQSILFSTLKYEKPEAIRLAGILWIKVVRH